MPVAFRPLSAQDTRHNNVSVPTHDHSHCVESAMEAAERLCADAGARLTPLRKRVLELVWACHKPLGAYELLDQLAQEGHKPAPPTIYRALDFLLQHGLVHRITSLNAFLGCSHPEHSHGGYFLICQKCGIAEELQDVKNVTTAIDSASAAAGFTVTHAALELIGTCQSCATHATAEQAAGSQDAR